MAEYKLSFTAKEIEDRLKLISSKQVLLEKQNFNFQSWEDLGGLYAWEDPLRELIPGYEYLVEWDNIEYICKAFDVSSMAGHTAFGMGSMPSMGITGNNEPFAIIYHTGEIPEMTLIASNGSTETVHSLAISKITNLTDNVSWSNLKDRPFGEDNIIARANINTVKEDVVYEGFGYNWVKISDETIPRECVEGARFRYFIGNIPVVDFEIPKELIILNQEEGVAIQFGTSGALTMNYVAGEISAEVNGNEITINIPEAGLYFIGDKNPFANENEMIEIVGKINKVLDPKYLPMDAIDARINEVISTALEGEY